MDQTRIRTFTNGLPADAAAVRRAVFMDEQGFEDEFDEVDARAVHIVAYVGETPAATCRVFADKRAGAWTMGRLCVLASFRGQRLGAQTLVAAEKVAREHGARELRLHAQERKRGFYEHLGYAAETGDVELDEGVGHLWMSREL